MRLPFVFFVTIILLFSCNSNNEPSGSESLEDSTKVLRPELLSDTAISGCYAYYSGRDTAFLQLQAKDSMNVSGQLSYNNFEKDRNDGSILGERRNNLIYVWYLFRSEGVISVRQEVFKIEKDRMIPADGEIIQRNDTTLFAKPDQLNFNNNRAFTRIPCTT